MAHGGFLSKITTVVIYTFTMTYTRTYSEIHWENNSVMHSVPPCPFRGIHSASLAIQQQLAADLPPQDIITFY